MPFCYMKASFGCKKTFSIPHIMAGSTIGEPCEKEDEQEMEKDIYTHDGSVDWNGHPCIRKKSGGWVVGILLLANQGLATLAFFGVGVNLVLFMMKVMRLENAKAANHVSNWTGTAYIFSLVGAFVSDSYWGRYKTCAVFQLIFIAGLVELALSSYFLLLRPCVPSDANPDCKPPTDLEILIFYISIYQIALGNGAYQPVVTTFGADQFDEQDKEEGQSKMAFFSYFFMANNLGTLFSNTLLAYVEDRGDWVLGFWISAGAAFLAAVLFFAGTPQFRHFKPGGNPLTRVSQVVVASMKNWKVTVPPEGENLYEDDKKHCAINGGRKILHTPDFTFLDRAAVYTDKDPTSEDQEQPLRPWSLCTVTQVEEVKSILRLMPIWLCTIIYSLVYAQMSSIFIEQGAVMKTSISSFHIPPACMSLFEVSSVAAVILLYRLYIVPFLKVSNGRLKGLTELQRMGIGLVISTVAMILAGLVELQRLKHAKKDCYTCRGSSSLSILWQIPQYVLIGVSEVFMYVGQLEFFNNQIPETIKSFGSALYVANMSAGSYLSSLLVTIVMDITGKGDQTGWISENLNKGHMDRFYFLLAALNTLDLVVFMACAKRYRCILLDGRVQFGNDDRMSKTDI